MRRVGLLVLVHVIACSDDGVAATSDDPSDGGTTGNTATMSGSAGTDMTASGTTAESSGSTVSSSTSDDTTGPASTSTDPSADTSGTGSSSESGSTTGEVEPCEGPRDCQVLDTCCDCSAIPADAEPPKCEENCEQSMCAALGITPVAQCDEGTCQVVDAAAQSCDDCDEDEVCVQNVAQMVTTMCVPIDPDCGGTPTCECMGEVCQDPFGTCNDDGDGIDCICIAC